MRFNRQGYSNKEFTLIYRDILRDILTPLLSPWFYLYFELLAKAFQWLIFYLKVKCCSQLTVTLFPCIKSILLFLFKFFLSQSLLNTSIQSMFRSRFCEQTEKLSATRELLCMGKIYHSPFISSFKLIIGFHTIII